MRDLSCTKNQSIGASTQVFVASRPSNAIQESRPAFIEYRTAGIHVASTSVLREIDDAQTRFVQHTEVSQVSALMNLNLAPLSTKTTKAVLGRINIAHLQQDPPSLWKFFHGNTTQRVTSTLRGSRHSLQIMEWPPGRKLENMRRSALGMLRA